MSKQAILAVSFGTTYATTRAKTIDATIAQLQAAHPTYHIVQAYTSGIVRRRILANENLAIDSPEVALAKLRTAGYDEVIIQSLHLLPGWEYQLLEKLLQAEHDHFKVLRLTPPLLASFEDFQRITAFMKQEAASLATDEAILWMGHGSSHSCFTMYACLDHMLTDSANFVAAVESYPSLAHELPLLQARGVKKVHLQPLMLVAGNHAHNDMAGGKDSWQGQLQQHGFEPIACFKGLGEYPAIQQMFVDKLKMVLED